MIIAKGYVKLEGLLYLEKGEERDCIDETIRKERGRFQQRFVENLTLSDEKRVAKIELFAGKGEREMILKMQEPNTNEVLVMMAVKHKDIDAALKLEQMKIPYKIKVGKNSFTVTFYSSIFHAMH